MNPAHQTSLVNIKNINLVFTSLLCLKLRTQPLKTEEVAPGGYDDATYLPPISNGDLTLMNTFSPGVKPRASHVVRSCTPPSTLATFLQ